MNSLIKAALVFDGGYVEIPEDMGVPREDQMQGTPAEQLSEISGRVCYDSLGVGRPSFDHQVLDPNDGLKSKFTQGYHSHILEVGHGSVLEHFHFTVEVGNSTENGDVRLFRELTAWLCVNRPGVLLMPSEVGVRITLNLRSVIEWENFTRDFYVNSGVADESYKSPDDKLRLSLVQIAKRLAPHIIKDEGKDSNVKLVDPANDHERWVTMYMTGSRGLSHELVRHGDFTAISQRSTRFVNESESPWVEHPLTEAYENDLKDTVRGASAADFVFFQEHRQHAIRDCRNVYDETVSKLEPWLSARGLDKTSARKQARGAARGYLGNALHTSLIFSASVAQWQRMLRQRASQFADAEIRELFCKALGVLKSSRYGDRFSNWRLEKSPDGIGEVGIELKELDESGE